MLGYMDVFLSNGDNAALVPWLYDHSLRKRIPIEMRLEYIIYKITMNMILYNGYIQNFHLLLHKLQFTLDLLCLYS